MNLKEKLKNILKLDKYANHMGFSQTCLVLASNIILDERVRIHCQINLCGNYGNNLMCPPYLPSVSENRILLQKYNFALLLQLHQSLSSKTKEEMKDTYFSMALHFNQMLVALERKAFASGFRLALALGAGECKLCQNCVVKEGIKQCLRPGDSRPSMEGMGIDVLQTFRNAGLSLDFQQGELTLAGLLLID